MSDNTLEDQTVVQRETVSRLTPKERGDRIFAYLLNVPSVILILALIAYPVIVSLWTKLAPLQSAASPRLCLRWARQLY